MRQTRMVMRASHTPGTLIGLAVTTTPESVCLSWQYRPPKLCTSQNETTGAWTNTKEQHGNWIDPQTVELFVRCTHEKEGPIFSHIPDLTRWALAQKDTWAHAWEQHWKWLDLKRSSHSWFIPISIITLKSLTQNGVRTRFSTTWPSLLRRSRVRLIGSRRAATQNDGTDETHLAISVILNEIQQNKRYLWWKKAIMLPSS